MTRKPISIISQRAKYVVTDWVMSFIAFLIFDIYRFHFTGDTGSLTDFIFSHKLVVEQLLIPTAMLGIYWLSGYYNQPFNKSRLQEFVTTLFSALINTAAIFLILLINDVRVRRTDNYLMILMLIAVLFIFTYVGRLIITCAATRHFREKSWAIRTLMVGNSPQARAIASQLCSDQSRYGYQIVGFVAIPGESQVDDDSPVYELSEISTLCRSLKIDQLVMAPEKYDDERELALLYDLYNLHIPLKIAPDTLSFVTSGIHLTDIFGDPFIDLTSPRISDSAKNVKRFADVTFSIIALVLLAPVYLLIALLVKSDSKGPVIYRQTRIGLRHRPFTIYKFRTMRTDAEAKGPQLTSDADPRITSLGKTLRKYRLDELPQFWNVLIGDMSMVGPRPEREFFIRQIVKEAPYYTLVHQVRPGITSWGMVKYGYASNVSQMVERTRYDLIYLANMSTLVDMKILVYTLKTIITGKGK